MSKKVFILTILYFIAIAVAVFLITTAAQATNAHDFLLSRKEHMINNSDQNNYELISAIAVANSRGNEQAVILSEPIAQSTNQFANIAVYNFITFSDQRKTNQLAIILRNINLPDAETGLQLPVDVLRMRIDFASLVSLPDGNIMHATTELIPVFDEQIAFIVINLDAIKTNQRFPGFHRLRFMMAVSPVEDQPVYEMSDEELYQINNADLYLTNRFNQNNFNQAIQEGILQQVPNLTNLFSSYNPLAIYLLIAIPIIIIITYFLYFHRHIMTMVKAKKEYKKQQQKEIYDQTILEYNDTKKGENDK